MGQTLAGQLIRLYAQIAVLRRGPQDVPASTLLLVVTVIGYFLINAAVNAVLPPSDAAWLPHLLLEIGFNLAWYALWLKLVRRPERILQTTTAVFGFQAVLSPIMIVSDWLALRFQHDAFWQLPFSLIVLVLLIWLIAALGNVVKAALEWSGPASVALAILQVLVESLLAVWISGLKP